MIYLFDDLNVIHDDVKGLGYVDDMVVMNYTLGILEKKCFDKDYLSIDRNSGINDSLIIE